MLHRHYLCSRAAGHFCGVVWVPTSRCHQYSTERFRAGTFHCQSLQRWMLYTAASSVRHPHRIIVSEMLYQQEDNCFLLLLLLLFFWLSRCLCKHTPGSITCVDACLVNNNGFRDWSTTLCLWRKIELVFICLQIVAGRGLQYVALLTLLHNNSSTCVVMRIVTDFFCNVLRYVSLPIAGK